MVRMGGCHVPQTNQDDSHQQKSSRKVGGAKSAELCPVWEKYIVEHFAAFRTLWILERFFPSAHVVLAFVARLLRPLLLAWVGSGTRFILGRCSIER